MGELGIEQGTWYTIHLTAKHAQSASQKAAFIDLMKTLSLFYRCAKCRKHMTAYINENPIEVYLNNEDGLFFWSWKFHNAVNKRLGKPEIDYNTALEMFEPDFSPCTQGCDEISESSVQQKYPSSSNIYYGVGSSGYNQGLTSQHNGIYNYGNHGKYRITYSSSYTKNNSNNSFSNGHYNGNNQKMFKQTSRSSLITPK
ncbi:Erv1 / Alr family protein [compost metagenome]